MSDSSNIFKLFFVLIFLTANLIGQFYFKYSIYDISISEINFGYLGNIFSLLLSFLIILGAIVLWVFNRGYETREFSFILVVSIFAISSYLIGYVLVKAHYSPLDSYIMGVTSRRFYLAIIFLINLFLQFYLLSYIWGTILGRQSKGSLKAISGATLALALALLFSYYYITSQDYRNSNYQKMPYYDTAVVLGAAVWSNNEPSTIFAGRIKKVYQLARNGRVRTIQLTGGSAPGEISEAEAAKKYLEKLGLKGGYIVLEEQTATTSQQIEFVRNKYFKGKNNSLNKKIVIISDDFHLPRALEMGKYFNIELRGLASDTILSLDKLVYYRTRESIALLLFWLFGI